MLLCPNKKLFRRVCFPALASCWALLSPTMALAKSVDAFHFSIGTSLTYIGKEQGMSYGLQVGYNRPLGNDIYIGLDFHFRNLGQFKSTGVIPVNIKMGAVSLPIGVVLVENLANWQLLSYFRFGFVKLSFSTADEIPFSNKTNEKVWNKKMWGVGLRFTAHKTGLMAALEYTRIKAYFPDMSEISRVKLLNYSSSNPSIDFEDVVLHQFMVQVGYRF